ncbi:MAG: helix-turn-helix domain-containing protein [Eubacteriales bacterium]|nr:helix-turn-helix domain-containing protein [Eubacteriales bacterium]
MEELKKCMREAASILDKVAGVLNADAVILASTDEQLEGREDQNARAVFLSDEPIVISAGKIYQKLNVGDKNSLTAFIEGTDSVARNYLELLTRWILSELKEPNTDVEQEAFLKNVLLENELPGDVPLKAREYKIQYTMPRIAFLVRIDHAEEVDCLEIMQNLFPDRRSSFVLAMDEETIVLLTDFQKDDSDFIDRTAATILDTINAESMAKVRIGIGMVADTLKDSAKSYREASLALTVGNIFENETYVMRYDKLGLGRLIYQLPPTLCHMFLDEVFPKGAYESLDSETLLTIQKFFENNLNGSETSRQLFVHRNTLVYRLDKVQKITSLDLRSFDDAVLFKLASMVRKYLEKQEKGSLKNNASKWWHS